MSKLREAAQAVVDHGPHRMTACSPLHWNNQSAVPHAPIPNVPALEGAYLLNLYNAIERLAAALAEDRLNEMQAVTESDYGQKNLAAAVAAEREACAEICDRHTKVYLDRRELSDWESGYVDGATECFDAIRARGEQK